MDRRERIPTLHELKLAGRVERARALFGPGGYICLDFVSDPPDTKSPATPGDAAGDTTGRTTGRTTGHRRGEEEAGKEEGNEKEEGEEEEQGGEFTSSSPPNHPVEVGREGSEERRVGGGGGGLGQHSKSGSSPQSTRGSMDVGGKELPPPLSPSPTAENEGHEPTPGRRLVPGEGNSLGGNAESISAATGNDQYGPPAPGEERHGPIGERSPRARKAGRGRGAVWTVTLKIVGGRPTYRPGFPNLEPRGNVRVMAGLGASSRAPAPRVVVG